MRNRLFLACAAMLVSGAALAQYDPFDPRGLTVKAGGGVEGYTGSLDNFTNVGPAWGVSVDVRPLRIMSVEFAYTGATNEVSDNITGGDVGLTPGPDIVRSGGQAAVLIGLPTRIQPYLMGGVGVDYYSVRSDALGYTNDTSGSVPLGVGIRGNTDVFTADLRVNYVGMFSDSFLGQGNNDFGDGRYGATLHLGGKF